MKEEAKTLASLHYSELEGLRAYLECLAAWGHDVKARLARVDWEMYSRREL